MKTCRTISNISYNTDEFFIRTIDDLFKSGQIEFCYWIRHEPDEDDKKSHIHFVLRPSSRVDTMLLKKRFDELTPDNPKPLSCTSVWHITNSMQDWILYALHDEAYLNSKHLSRNHHYGLDELLATDFDALNYELSMIDRTAFDRLAILEKAVKSGVPFFELVQNGTIPISQRAQYQYQYDDLRRSYYTDNDFGYAELKSNLVKTDFTSQ